MVPQRMLSLLVRHLLYEKTSCSIDWIFILSVNGIQIVILLNSQLVLKCPSFCALTKVAYMVRSY